MRLPQAVDLDGNWELGVYSISYPNSWYTLRNINVDMHFYCDDASGFFSAAYMDYGCYETMQEFIKNANKGLKKETGDDSIYFTYSTLMGKVTCHLKPRHIARKISLTLGYAGKKTIIDATSGSAQESPYVADLSTFTSIYSLVPSRSQLTPTKNEQIKQA